MDEKFADLSKYRIEQSIQCIESAKALMELGDYKGAANRSYYGIFHAMRAVLALDRVDFSKHSGVSAYFRKEYIKSGIFEVEMSDIIKSAFDVRSNSDYDDYYVISREEIVKQIENAGKFEKMVEQYVKIRTSWKQWRRNSITVTVYAHEMNLSAEEIAAKLEMKKEDVEKIINESEPL